MDASTYPTSAPATPSEIPALAAESSAASAAVGLAIVLSLLATVALWFAGQAQLLRMALPAMATAIGLILFFQRPILYYQYALWVWFLVPFVRRVVDWRFGFMDPNFLMLAPFLVSAIAGLTLLPQRHKDWPHPPAAFVLCAAGIVYGFVVGILMQASAETVFGLLNWFCPLLLGFHIYTDWARYPQYRAATLRVFVWAVLILGAYGVYQFFFPLNWDLYWLESVKSTSASFGNPQPLEVRVWSTLNSPGPFANVMMVGLLLLIIVRSPLKLPAAIAGYLSFLMTVVRTAWLSWVVGFVWLLKSAKPHVMIRVLLSIVLVVACLLPLVNDPRLAPVIGDRLKSFTDLGHDDSFAVRAEMYRLLLQDAVNNPFGNGLKNMEVSHGMAVDSGILIAIFSLGWLGSALYALGVFLLFWGHSRLPAQTDEFSAASKAILIALLAQIVSGPIFVNVTGVMFWIFAGLYLSASTFHNHHASDTQIASPKEQDAQMLAAYRHA